MLNIQEEEKYILEAIRSEGTIGNAALERFYKDAKELFAAFVHKNKGDKEDIEDIFQEGIQYLVLNVRNEVFQHKSALKTYLFRICRNLWLAKLRRENKWKSIKQILQSEEPVFKNTTIEKKERKELLDQALSFISEVCRQVLYLWAQGYSMKEIATLTGYKNEKSAKKKKSICMKALVEKMKNQPELMKALLNYL